MYNFSDKLKRAIIASRLCCLLLFLGITSLAYSQGLLFHNDGKLIEDRTSLRLFADGDGPRFTKSFRLSFDLSIRGFHELGYFFLLKGAESKENFSFTYNYLEGDKSGFMFNVDGKKNYYTLALDNKYLAHKWIPVSFEFDLQQDSLIICIDRHRTVIGGLNLQKAFSPQLYFGWYDYILNVPYFGIKNVEISGDNYSCFFPLDESSGENVHNSNGEVYGKAINPIWLINLSYHWQLLFETYSQSSSGFTYDENGQKLIAFNQDSVLIYNLWTREMQKHSYANLLPVQFQLATNFFNPTDGKLYVYEVYGQPEGSPTVAKLDMDSYSWTPVGKASLPTQLHHHNGFWSRVDNKYILFGGFGSKSYTNTFHSYDITSDEWGTIPLSGDFITPRCFSGMAVSDDQRRMYIHGGMGNDQGDQTLGHIYLSDLHLVNLDEKKTRKLWQKDTSIRQVSVRDMILTDDEQYIYTLCYPEYLSDTYLQLHRLNVATGEAIILGDSIPMRSNEINSNANLYYNRIAQEYYCVTLDFDKYGNVITKVYSLQDTPVSLTDMQQYSNMAYKKRRSILFFYLLPTLVFAVCLIIFFSKRKRKPVTEIPVEIEKAPLPHPATDQFSLPVRPNSIYLFGTFTVIDRKGQNIAHLFSTRLRQFLVYILLHGSNGVLSISLNEVFWPDKPDAKVKNLKGVTINQIRKNLSELDGIELINERGYYRLVNTGCFCDYTHFLQLKGNPGVTKELSLLLMRGRFLESFDLSAFDLFKSQVEEFFFSFLTIEIERLYEEHRYETVIRFCHILLGADPLNQEALVYCIHAMNKIGASQEAIMVYSEFARQYKQSENEVFPLSYSALMKENPRFHR